MRHKTLLAVLIILSTTSAYAASLAEAVSIRYLAHNTKAGCEMLTQLKVLSPALCERYITKRHPNCLDELVAFLTEAKELGSLRADLLQRLQWIHDDYTAVVKSRAAGETELSRVLQTLADRYLKTNTDAETAQFAATVEPVQSAAEIQRLIAQTAERQKTELDPQSVQESFERLVNPQTGEISSVKKSLGTLHEWLAQANANEALTARKAVADQAFFNDVRGDIVKAVVTAESFVRALEIERELGGATSLKLKNQVINVRNQLMDLKMMTKELIRLTPNTLTNNNRNRTAQERTLIEAGGYKRSTPLIKPVHDLQQLLKKIETLSAALGPKI